MYTQHHADALVSVRAHTNTHTYIHKHSCPGLPAEFLVIPSSSVVTRELSLTMVRVPVAMQQVSICTYGYNQSSSLVPKL